MTWVGPDLPIFPEEAAQPVVRHTPAQVYEQAKARLIKIEHDLVLARECVIEAMVALVAEGLPVDGWYACAGMARRGDILVRQDDSGQWKANHWWRTQAGGNSCDTPRAAVEMLSRDLDPYAREAALALLAKIPVTAPATPGEDA